MDLRQLRYFIAIVDHASLSKAAMHLHIAQPALSQHIRHMEEELEVALLFRAARGVTPTEAGDRLYKRAKVILALADDLRHSVRGGADSPVGEVRIGMSGTVSDLVSVPLIEAARERFPGIRVRPVEAMSGYVLDWLRRGEVDVAMVFTPEDTRGLTVHAVLTEVLCLFGKRGAKPHGLPGGEDISLAAALRLDLITPGNTHGLRRLINDAALATGVTLEPLLEIDSLPQIKKLSQLGRGYGILPETVIAREVEEGLFDMWTITQPNLVRSICLTYANDRKMSVATRALTGLCWEVTRQLVNEGIWKAILASDQEVLSF